MLSTSEKFRVASWTVCIIAGIVLLWTGLGIYLYEPRFSIIYRDLGLALPGITEFIMWTSRTGAWVALPFVAIAQIALERRFNGSPVRLWLNCAYLFIALLVMAFVVIAAFLPLIVTIDNMSTLGST